MSQKLNKQLQILEQQAKNEMFIKQQRQREKPPSLKLTEKFQLPKKDEQLLVKEQEETVEDFDPTLIELDPAEVPADILAEMQNVINLLDTELGPDMQEIEDISNEADQLRRRARMNALIAKGNLITPTLEAELPGTVEYDDMQGILDAELQQRIDDFNQGAPVRTDYQPDSKGTKAYNKDVKTFNGLAATFKNNEEAKLNDDYAPTIANKNLQALENYKRAFIKYVSDKLQQDNKEKLKTYVKRIENQNLYSNVINVNRLPGESDESYAERLDSFRNIPSFVDQQKLQLYQREKSKLKQSLSKIMSEVNAQRIINLPEIDENNIVDINKNFPRFESEIKRNFKGLKIDEFKDYFIDFVNKIAGQPLSFETLDMTLGDQLNKTANEIQDKLADIESQLPQNNPADPNQWNLEDVINDGEGWITNNTSANSRKAYKTLTKDNIKKNKDVMDIIGNNKYFNNFLNQQNDTLQVPALIRRLNPIVMKYRNKLVDDGKTKDEAKEEAKKIFGYGINHVPKEYIPFGKLILDLPRLQHQNKLRVLYPNHINVKELRTTAVSQNFESIITQLLETNKFNHSLFDHLDKSEQDLMVLLFERAGLHQYLKDIKTKRDKEVDKHIRSQKEGQYSVNKLPKETIDRWNVVKGSILAGNDNRNLVKEAINIVNTFKAVGHVSSQDADEQIEYLKTLL
jgi:hypothetical protein